MKKILVLLAICLISASFVGCVKDIVEVVESEMDGYTLIGSSDNPSDCSYSCSMQGYTQSRFVHDSNNCYCR